ncbi:MAG TPA: DUF1203 domain-containing protein [Acetobacteraceae bacterium]|jgi:hypothetical protein|nr:DUF1203 domain-containing protein [Acetobacteraceae bacterium]
MDFRITGLPVEPFVPFYTMADAELLAHGARRVVAKPEDAPLMQPCRVSLRDSEPGEVSILLNYPHHVTATSPYRASGPIFVRQGVYETASVVNRVPAQQRTRLLSVRAYDSAGIMVDAEVMEGTELEAIIDRMFRRDDVAFLHAHNARRGCYSCRIDRA